MVKSVYKYPLEITDSQTVWMPKGSEILSLQVQSGCPFIWALTDPNAVPEERTFEVYGTGHDIQHISSRTYVGTVQTNGGMLVWHVFEIK